ncbi:hypothetical protein QVD17_28601 [Tagetes erecta]|uniref:Uncharacterized protein n=1 Tax=Tagetes erecta TaxID=13708 RepID=A0AAD8NS92_TARER|nr:hypothetical protein QVD17_28601 [Tagetes erecta]
MCSSSSATIVIGFVEDDVKKSRFSIKPVVVVLAFPSSLLLLFHRKNLLFLGEDDDEQSRVSIKGRIVMDDGS